MKIWIVNLLMDWLFDEQSINAIEDIKRRNDLFTTLSKVMTHGVLFNIFAVGRGIGPGLKIPSNIKQTDFEVMAMALKAMPVIQRRVIQKIAEEQAIYHISKHKEFTFWKNIAEGCSVE